MDFKVLTEKDFEQHQELMVYAFQPLRNSYFNIDLSFYENYPKPFTLLGLFDDDILVSTLGIFNSYQRIRNTVLPMAGIFAVTTKPEYRRQGFGKKLFKKTIIYCLENNLPISIIYPLKYSYYEQFGYAWVEDQVSIITKISNLKKNTVKNGSYYIEEEKSYQNALKRIKPLYRLYFDYINGLIDREKSDTLFNRRFPNGFFFFCKDEKEKDAGYLVINYRDQDTLLVNELVAPNQAVRICFWDFLSSHKESLKKIEILDFLSHEIRTYPYLIEPRLEKRESIANSMFRIISVSQTLTQIHYPNITINLNFFLLDQFSEINKGTWNLQITNGRGSIKKLENIKQSDSNLVIDIKGLNLLVTGFRNTQELVELSLLSGSSEEMKTFDQLFPKQRFVVRDWF